MSTHETHVEAHLECEGIRQGAEALLRPVALVTIEAEPVIRDGELTAVRITRIIKAAHEGGEGQQPLNSL